MQIKGLKITDNMKERIRTGTYRFHDKYWNDISVDAKEVWMLWLKYITLTHHSWWRHCCARTPRDA